MGRPALSAEEQKIIRAFLAQGISIDEICDERYHLWSTVSDVKEGRCPIAAQPVEWQPPSRQPDPAGPEITVEQQVAVDQAAREIRPAPGRRTGCFNRLRQIADLAKTDLATVCRLLGHHLPGPIPIIGKDGDRHLFYADGATI